MGVIFDLDQTIIDSSIAYYERRNRKNGKGFIWMREKWQFRGRERGEG